MSWTKKVKIISVTFALLIMLITSFLLIHGFSDTASGPFSSVSGNSYANSGIDGLSAALIAPDSPDMSVSSGIKTAPENELALLESNNYITFALDETDIARGSLILVNYDNNYIIPDERVLSCLAELKTSSYRISDNDLLLSGLMIGPLNNMMDAFYNETGCDTVTIISAYRDYERQDEIYNEYTYLVGQNDANKWAAFPGHSEHHTGLAVDFGIIRSGVLRTFLGNDIYEWFFLNCYEYGFINRYPEDKNEITKTVYEPWHFRYVGLPHAFFIHQNGFCFEEYIEYVKCFTRDNPYRATYNDDTYEIYYTKDYEIPVPVGCKVDISGNNEDGFIVTIKCT